MVESYFLIFYIGKNDKGTFYGNVALEYSSEFPNQYETVAYINKSQNCSESLITSLIRLSKSEYEEWCRK